MKDVIFQADRVTTGHRDKVCFKLPDELNELVWHFIRQVEVANQRFVIRLSTPRKHRTTGQFSQSHHLNGHVQQIAMDTGNDFTTVKETAKDRAIKRGYPFITTLDGKVRPLSETEIDTVQAGYLIDELHQLAAELNIRLREGYEDEV
jgi:hypothetical protein